MATIEAYATKSGKRYRVRYRKPDRKPTDKRGFKTKREAEAFAATVEVSKLKGEFIDATASRATIGTLGPAWLGRQSHLKPSALRPVESAWRIHVEPHWGKIPVAEIRKTGVQQWVSNLSNGDKSATPPRSPKGATTVIRAYGVLASILDEAVDDRRILSNPSRGVNLPRKTKKPHVYLSHEQVHTLAETSKYPLLVLVLAYCGLRWGEVTGLRVRDVNMIRRRLQLEQNAVDVGGKIMVGTLKSHKSRAVPFPKFLEQAMGEACKDKHRDDLVFPGPSGSYMGIAASGEERGSWFASAVTSSGIPRVTPHDLRHTAASFAVSAGANVKAVQRMLGHSSAAMTLDIYAELFDDDLDAVAVALDKAVTESIVGKKWAKQ
ncbi:site-specific integrase [Arthrobacter sp. MYb227]|uniref:site-specific integrase n=1 Tax=Arthrobacter sp. MYb227 TaxID=1848601 RepID=UPI000CFCF1B0|nr:site-specific integrase [Arthrobacter sp. MYb227]PQZ91678.1 site-specific integrase [Arthrobacter sp. MYb227]